MAMLKSRDKISAVCTQAFSLSDINLKDMTIQTRLNFFLVTESSGLRHSSSEILESTLSLFLSLNSLFPRRLE